MRTHLIMNSHRLARFQVIKTEGTNVKQAWSAVMARSGDTMDVDAFTKGFKGACTGSGKKQDPEVVCWYYEKKGLRAFECRKKQRDNDSGKSEGSKRGDSKGKSNKKEFKGKCYKLGKIGHMSKDCGSKETSAFEAGDELAETRSDRSSAVAVTVFPKSVADDYPMLHTPGMAKSYRPASSASSSTSLH